MSSSPSQPPTPKATSIVGRIRRISDITCYDDKDCLVNPKDGAPSEGLRARTTIHSRRSHRSHEIAVADTSGDMLAAVASLTATVQLFQLNFTEAQQRQDNAMRMQETGMGRILEALQACCSVCVMA